MEKLVTTLVAGLSDIGKVRKSNEDNFLIADLGNGRVYLIPQKITHKLEQNRLLLAVSDGVGGANFGEVASSMAVHSMRVELLKKNRLSLTPVEQLIRAVERANEIIWTEAQNNPARKGMAATITAALIDHDMAYVAEVGDSRGYLIHGGRIKQITTDQSLVGILQQRGLISNEQAKKAPARNIILQSLGYQANVKVAVTSIELTVGDYLLLCSDGLSNKLRDEEMHAIIMASENLEQACKDLISEANRRGGEDNITVVLARFEGSGLRPTSHTASLTTRIEVLSSYNPDAKSAKETDKKTKLAESTPVTPPATSDAGTLEMESGRHIAEAVFAKIAQPAKSPTRYNRVQLTEQAKSALNQIVLANASLRKLQEIVESFAYWEQDESQQAELKKLSLFLLEMCSDIENKKQSVEEMNRFLKNLKT
ncbi:MAG: Stp1/IreP family PP2C-type Ser/Thr phosphatase [Acidobacteriota bacterium]|nr:Stp1/IreP family PP2C-type Ser/Thr phosphatase [Blastocatellia bacterium]MDW8413690.1 Stp1/IreP family PP2C-type Ser/Thr phosphatase [Acidobacteriota bacterium]